MNQLAIGFLLALPIMASAQLSNTLTVSAQSNIFAAGRQESINSLGSYDGWLPVAITFQPRTGQWITFTSVTGRIASFYNMNYPDSWHGADGDNLGDWSTDHLGTDVYSFNGLSGIRDETSLPLVGVFLNDEIPSDPAPPRLDFMQAHEFETLSPQLKQIFFIGDGLTKTGTGQRQKFYIPPTATRLFLGFAESSQLWTKLPGEYNDNSGELVVAYEITLPPEATQPELERVREESWQAGRQACLAPYSLTGGILIVPCVAVTGPFGATLLYQAEMHLIPLTEPFEFLLTNIIPIAAK